MDTRPRYHYRSLFWPIVLIGVGAIWLLVNLGYIAVANLVGIWKLWPLLLIAAGLDLLVGRRLPIVGALFGLATVGLVIFILVAGVQLPGARPVGVVTERLHTPLESAKSAQVTLDLWSDPVRVYSLSGSPELVDANITHTGQVDLTSTGAANKNIHLDHRADFNPEFFTFGSPDQRADIGLTPSIPLELAVNSASGSQEFDLSGLNLASFALDAASGSVNMTLPKSAASYPVRLDGASGSINVNVQDGASFKMKIDSASGSISIHLPQNAAVRIDVQDNGSGSLSVGSGFNRISGNDEIGVWETPGYASASNQIEITVTSFGSGSISFSR